MTVRLLLAKDGVDASPKDNYGVIPLSMAASHVSALLLHANGGADNTADKAFRLWPSPSLNTQSDCQSVTAFK